MLVVAERVSRNLKDTPDLEGKCGELFQNKSPWPSEKVFPLTGSSSVEEIL
jgi:hypothetical protein